MFAAIEARRAISSTFPVLSRADSHARLSNPQLRRVARRQRRETVRLSGWIHRKRDHGQLLFVDLRDHFGITQIVADTESPAFKTLDRSARRIGRDGRRQGCRPFPETVNSNLADRRDRGSWPRRDGSIGGCRAADAGRRGAGLSRGDPAQVSLPRPSPRAGPRATSCCARR